MLSILKENAASCNSYVRMEDLEPGTYEILTFSLRNTRNGKRLVMEIKEGSVYLPEKMMNKFNTEEAVAKLNKKRYDFIYEGKDEEAPNRKMFTFEIHRPSATDEDDSDDDLASTSSANLSKKKKTTQKKK